MKDNLVAWLVGPVLMLLALAIYLSPRLESLPLSAPPLVDASQIDPAPLRNPSQQPPVMQVAGYQKACMDCHDLFKSKATTPFAMFQHVEIQRAMNHGINTRCYNCHDLESRDKLVLDDGVLVGFDQVELVCAKCHGTTYRAWQRGSHGKTMGYWDKSFGEPDRLTCTQCHDPHAPAFGKFQPLPGPHTLRMNAIPKSHSDKHVRRKVNPLRTWSSSNSPDVGQSHHPTGTTEPESAEATATGQEESHE